MDVFNILVKPTDLAIIFNALKYVGQWNKLLYQHIVIKTSKNLTLK
jgi:hypothetical protein